MRRLKEQLVVLIVCVAVAAAMALVGDVGERFEALLVYDAEHDVLPDWLWDAGVPGNKHTR